MLLIIDDTSNISIESTDREKYNLSYSLKDSHFPERDYEWIIILLIKKNELTIYIDILYSGCSLSSFRSVD